MCNQLFVYIGNHRLCASYIIAHSAAFVDVADELSEKINRLAEQLNISLQKIQTIHTEPTNAVDMWGQTQIGIIKRMFSLNGIQ